MSKALCLAGLVVAVLLAVVFGLDLAIGFPFHGVNKIMDIGIVVCAAALGYISWMTFKEQK